MTINKNSIAILFIIFLTLFFGGCSPAKNEEEAKIFNESRYDVIVKIGTTESLATINIKAGEIQLEYNDPASSLCGLKETFQKNHYTSEYQSIIWESEEFIPATYTIFEALEQLKKATETVNTDFEGEEAIVITKMAEDGEYQFILNKNANKPIELCAARNGIELSLRFINQ